jgi:lipoprotein NlpD
MVILIIGFLFPACSGHPAKSMKTYQAKGIYHHVKSGETLYLIARAYNVNVQELAEANNIQDPSRIEADSVVFVPDARQAIDDIIASMETRRPTAGAVLPKAGQTVAKQPQEGDRAPVKPPVRETTMPSRAETPSGVTSMRPRAEAPPVVSSMRPRTESPIVVSSMRPRAETPPGVSAITPRAEAPPGMSAIRIKPSKLLERFPEASREGGKGTAPASEKEPPARHTEHASLVVQKPEQVHERVDAPPAVAAGVSQSVPEPPVVTAPPKADTETIQFDRKRFIWPVKGRVVSRFGIQPNGMYYNGITIAAGEDIPVVAAARGTVIFSGLLKDYGETIIVKHEDHYATVYTRLGQRKVKLDDRVKQADMIGYLGKGEEKGGGPRLNFEIRYHNKARNPMFFLP